MTKSKSEVHEKLLNDVPCSFLIVLYRTEKSPKSTKLCNADLATKISTTYSHTTKVSQFFKEKGLIEKQNNGRKKPIKLTEKGKEIAKNLLELEKSLKQEFPGEQP